MSKGIRYNGDYSITAADVAGNLSVSMHTMTIHGNLEVVGNISEVSNSSIADNFIMLNKGEPGPGVTTNSGLAGIEVDRGIENGGLPTTSIRWNENAIVAGQHVPRWEISNDGITWNGIAMTNQSGTQFSLIEDLQPQLGANLDVLGRTIFSSNNEVVTFGTSATELTPPGTWGSGISIINTAVVPGAISGTTVIYTQPPQNGGAGLYVTTNVNPSNPIKEELITKAKAIAYALIFR